MKKLLFILLIAFTQLNCFAQADSDTFETKIAEVLSVTETKEQEFIEQVAKVKILDTDLTKEDSEIFITNNVPYNKAYAINAEPGRKYLVGIDEELDQIYITDYYREPVVYFLLGLFCFVVILFGQFQGVKALVSLGLTATAIIYFFIPGILKGFDPILLAILASAFATAVTMVLIAGFSKKALAATIGTTGGVTIAGIIAFIAIKLAPLSGLASTEAHILLGNMPDANLDFQGMLAAGTIIASLGAAMDVAISISSATQEVYEANHRQGRRELFAHAVNIGKDIMGTMANTLILAYAGASIPLFMLLHNETGLRLLNLEIIATELCASVVGSIGLILAIPLTATAAVLLLKPPR